MWPGTGFKLIYYAAIQPFDLSVPMTTTSLCSRRLYLVHAHTFWKNPKVTRNERRTRTVACCLWIHLPCVYSMLIWQTYKHGLCSILFMCACWCYFTNILLCSPSYPTNNINTCIFAQIIIFNTMQYTHVIK